MRSREHSPPARDLGLIWIFAALIGVPLALWAQSSVRSIEVPSSQAFHDYNIERVDAFAERIDQGAIGVVMFGDSRLRYGTAVQDDLSAQLSDAMDADVAVLRVTNDWAILEDFVSLVPAILDAEPDLFLVQEELRARNRGSDARELLQREYLRWRLFGPGSWSPGDRPQEYLQEDTSCEVEETLEARAVRVAQWLDFDPDGPADGHLSDVVGQLESEGVDYRFLSVPVPEAATLGLPSIAATDGPRGLAPDVDIDDSFYCDLVHMDAQGRALYTDWLVGAVAAELDSNPRIT